MTMDLQNVRKYENVISKIYTKGDRRSESIYLDFENRYIYFGFNGIYGRIRLIVTSSDNISVPNFFVDTLTFLSLAKNFDSIELTDRHEFVNGKEKFVISYFEDVANFPSFSYSDPDSDWDSIEINPEYAQLIKFAYLNSCFDEYTDNSKYKGVRFIDNQIVGTDGIKLFRGLIDIKLPNFSIENDLLVYLVLFPKAENTKVYTNGKKVILSLNNEIEFIAPRNNRLSIPDPMSEQFQDKWDHSTYVILDRKVFKDILYFMSAFVKESRNEKLFFKILSENEVSIETTDKNIANRIVPIIKSSGSIIDQGFWFTRYHAYDALVIIDSDQVKVQFDPTKPSFNITGSTNDSRSVKIVRLK